MDNRSIDHTLAILSKHSAYLCICFTWCRMRLILCEKNAATKIFIASAARDVQTSHKMILLSHVISFTSNHVTGVHLTPVSILPRSTHVMISSFEEIFVVCLLLGCWHLVVLIQCTLYRYKLFVWHPIAVSECWYAISAALVSLVNHVSHE